MFVDVEGTVGIDQLLLDYICVAFWTNYEGDIDF